MLPRGIEPRSSVLQTGAMTTSAKAACFGVLWGIEPSRSDSQSDMRPLHQQHHGIGAGCENRTRDRSLEGYSFTIKLILQIFLVHPERLELPTLGFVDQYSDPTELRMHDWLQRQDSNLRFPAYETGRMTTSILCA